MGFAAKCASLDTHRRRLVKVIVLVVLAMVSLAVTSFDRASAGAPPNGYIGRVWERIVDGNDVESALGDAGLRVINAQEMPDWTHEISDFEQYGQILCDEEFRTIGISWNGTQDEAIQVLESELESRGWMVFAGGYEGLGTYIKEKGTCRWLMAECVKVGGEVSMVLHIEHI